MSVGGFSVMSVEPRYCHADMPLSKITNLIIVKTFEVFFIQENLDAFLDIGNLRVEPRLDLRDCLGYKLGVLHALSGLHDSDHGGLSRRVSNESQKRVGTE